MNFNNSLFHSFHHKVKACLREVCWRVAVLKKQASWKSQSWVGNIHFEQWESRITTQILSFLFCKCRILRHTSSGWLWKDVSWNQVVSFTSQEATNSLVASCYICWPPSFSFLFVPSPALLGPKFRNYCFRQTPTNAWHTNPTPWTRGSEESLQWILARETWAHFSNFTSKTF